MKPSSYNYSIGIFCKRSSFSDAYAIATPRDGCDVESYQGGSIIITIKSFYKKIPSNSFPVVLSCSLINFFQSNPKTSAQMGTAPSGTDDNSPAISPYSLNQSNFKASTQALALNLNFSNAAIFLGNLSYSIVSLRSISLSDLSLNYLMPKSKSFSSLPWSLP